MQEQIDEFIRKNDLQSIVAFSGGSDEAEEEVERVLADSMLYLKKEPVAILTGGTSWGIPKFASEMAKDYGLKTIGVLPERGTKYALSSLDLQLVVPPRLGDSQYGDESEVFVKLADAIEVIGGSAGTAIEFFHAMKINECREKYGEKPIVIAPVAGIPGFSSEVYNLGIVDGKLPRPPLMYGGDAAKYILSNLQESE